VLNAAGFSALPDLQGRTVIGVGTNASVDQVGDSDSVALASRTPTHSHTLANHTHTVNSHAHGPGSLWVQFTKGGGVYYSNEVSVTPWTAGQIGALQTNGGTYTIGSGVPLGGSGTTSAESPGTSGPSSNTSDAGTVPYLTLNYIIKN
jgi:microcystin-dependent protein